jgi:eukaryotic-like serine/threonine-protein kinase
MRTVLGLVACIAGIAAGHAAEPLKNYELALVDLQGQKKVLGTVSEPAFAPRVSPDGKRVAYEQANVPQPGDPQTYGIYVGSLDKLDRGRLLQQTVIARQNVGAAWSPDGDWIAFLATGNGGDTLFWQRSDGGIQPKFLVDGRAAEGLYEGGKLEAGTMLFLTLTGTRDYGISMLDIGTKKVTKVVDLPGSEQHSSEISPDGKWLAYTSSETGRQEVWLEPWPQTGKRYQLTKNGGNHAQWSPDGTKIYFDTGGQIYRMDVTTSGEPKAGDAVALPIRGFLQGDLRRQYDLTPDGKGFVMLFPATGAAPAAK